MAALVMALVITVGCAEKRIVLMPAPQATLATSPYSARAKADGVTIIAQAEAWNGRPRNLDKHVLPIKVTIQNHSGKPLSVRYKEFDLLSPSGEHLVAIPPYDITGTTYAQFTARPLGAPRLLAVSWNPEPQDVKPSKPSRSDNPDHSDHREKAHHHHRHRIVLRPEFAWDGYFVAPWWGYAYPGVGVWNYGWGPPDWGYYHQYYPYMSRVHLPTRSMLRKAIPEGVVSGGGDVTGFLYFQNPSISDTQQNLTFHATLVDASNGEQFGTIDIPFVGRKD